MDTYVMKTKNIKYSWLTISECCGDISRDLRQRDLCCIEKDITHLIAILLKISYENNINMLDAWIHWKTKAISKQYE